MKYNTHNLDKLVNDKDQLRSYKTLGKPIKRNKYFKRTNNVLNHQTSNQLCDYIMKELETCASSPKFFLPSSHK